MDATYLPCEKRVHIVRTLAEPGQLGARNSKKGLSMKIVRTLKLVSIQGGTKEIIAIHWENMNLVFENGDLKIPLFLH